MLETEDINVDDDEEASKGINNVVCYQSVSKRREVFPKLMTNLNHSPRHVTNEETHVLFYTSTSSLSKKDLKCRDYLTTPDSSSHNDQENIYTEKPLIKSIL
jgi:hypothetical protein